MSGPRWHVGCDACDAGAWVGPGVAGWCEACQISAPAATGADAALVCPRCGRALSLDTFGFEELWGAIQQVAAVLAAWAGDAAPLGAILPDRPRFLSDRNPPDPAIAAPGPARAALEQLAAGHYAQSRLGLEDVLGSAAEDGAEGAPRSAALWRALGVARERLGAAALAEEAYDEALARGSRPELHLARGVLRAERADFAGAGEDLALAGDTHEARWDRAALILLEAIAAAPGMPAASVLARARAAAGPASDYWSEPTVGRLLWALLVERAVAKARGAAPSATELATLRAAEAEFEFDTYWDRALIVQGFATLGARDDAARVAGPLALAGLGALAGAACLANPAARPVAEALAAATARVQAGDPAAARTALDALLARDDLARYRVPCGGCGKGTIGVDATEDGAGG